MVTAGKYSVWFKTPVGEGAGVVEFSPDGKLSGGDTTFSYIGNWTQEGVRFKAAIFARRMAPGPPGVFGMDEIDITLAGHSNGDASTSCTGFAMQSPALKLEVTLIRLCDD
ncbi:MAG: GrlR family regulatory protein [Bradyrhizobium sp.]